MTSKREQFYKRRIAELEAQLKQRNHRIAASDIVKPPKPKQSSGTPQQGGQPGHKGSNREPSMASIS